jgi:hypothetical protein
MTLMSQITSEPSVKSVPSVEKFELTAFRRLFTADSLKMKKSCHLCAIAQLLTFS